MVARVRSLTSSSSTAEYFHEEGGYYVTAGGDREAAQAKAEEHRKASAWYGRAASAREGARACGGAVLACREPGPGPAAAHSCGGGQHDAGCARALEEHRADPAAPERAADRGLLPQRAVAPPDRTGLFGRAGDGGAPSELRDRGLRQGVAGCVLDETKADPGLYRREGLGARGGGGADCSPGDAEAQGGAVAWHAARDLGRARGGALAVPRAGRALGGQPAMGMPEGPRPARRVHPLPGAGRLARRTPRARHAAPPGTGSGKRSRPARGARRGGVGGAARSSRSRSSGSIPSAGPACPTSC